MFKKIKDFFKKLFCREDAIEPEINSGETPVIIDVVDSGDTEPVVIPTNSGETEPTEIDEPITKPKTDIKILIDNGHGVNTAGKRSPYLTSGAKPAIEFYEYKWNREIAKPIVDELVKKGYDAELLVTEEKDIPLAERANRANKIAKEHGVNKTILISVHANAAGTGKEWMKARGWSAFTTKGTTKSDKIADFLYDEAEKNFKGLTIRKDTSDGDRDWEANFTIIYKSLCPAVLTENFFYDNVDDVKYILSEEGRAAVIKTHVDGIINYINSL